MVRRFVPLHESVEKTILDALGVPGLSHIETKTLLCDAEDKIGARIEFLIAGKPCGVSLMVTAEGSFVLADIKSADDGWTQNWGADEAEPDVITHAVVAALRRRVIEPVAT